MGFRLMVFEGHHDSVEAMKSIRGKSKVCPCRCERLSYFSYIFIHFAVCWMQAASTRSCMFENYKNLWDNTRHFNFYTQYCKYYLSYTNLKICVKREVSNSFNCKRIFTLYCNRYHDNNNTCSCHCKPKLLFPLRLCAGIFPFT